MTEECRHGLDPRTCGICTPPKRAVLVDLEADGPTVRARFPGSCKNCETRYGPEAEITPVKDIGWVGACCLEAR